MPRSRDWAFPPKRARSLDSFLNVPRIDMSCVRVSCSVVYMHRGSPGPCRSRPPFPEGLLGSMELPEIGKEIRHFRLVHGLSQGQLAAAVQLSRTTLNQLENGVIRDIGIRKVQAVLERLGLELTIERPSRRTRAHFLRLASTAASESFKTALSERELLTALLTGEVPANRRAHIRVLLEQAPPALARGLLKQVGRRTQPRKLQKNLAKLVKAVGLRNLPSQWLPRSAQGSQP